MRTHPRASKIERFLFVSLEEKAHIGKDGDIGMILKNLGLHVDIDHEPCVRVEVQIKVPKMTNPPFPRRLTHRKKGDIVVWSVPVTPMN